MQTDKMADISMDSTFDISTDLLDSTPIEKCSLNPRRKNSRRLLTGFIIYASEVRRQVVEKHPDQNFGFISRLVGDQWRALSSDIRFKYHQRALIHNKRMKDQAQKLGITFGSDQSPITNGLHKTPKLSKKKLAKLAKQEQKRLAQSANAALNHDKKLASSPLSTKLNGDEDRSFQPDTQNSTYKHSDHQYVQSNRPPKKTNSVDSSTQTPSIRFIEPPPKKRLVYSDAFLKRLEELKKQRELK